MSSSMRKKLKVLVLGASGAGKSSLINLFYCWSHNWNLQDIISNKRVLIKTRYLDGDDEAEEDVTNQNHSQTKLSKLYQFNLRTQTDNIEYLLDFIDTPGIGDTRGVEQDDQNLDEILDSVSKVEDLNAIILVLNGAEARQNSRIEFIVKKLRSVIPDALTKNLIVLLTNVELEPLLKIKELLDFPIDDSQIFYYNNQIFNLTPQYFKNKNILARAQQSYRDSILTLNDILEKIDSLPPLTTQLFCFMKEARDEFKKEVSNYGKMIQESLIGKMELENFSIEINLETHSRKEKLLRLICDAKKVCSRFDFIKEIDTYIKGFKVQMSILEKNQTSPEFELQMQRALKVENIMKTLKIELVNGLNSIKNQNVIINQLISKEIKVLVLGPSGAGKSSLIKLFYCWSHNWGLQDIISNKKELIKTRHLDGDDEAEEDVTNQNHSQTELSKLYQFNLRTQTDNIEYLLNFIDTPGIGDTRGVEQDDQNLDEILDSVSKVEDLNAIILVLNGAEARQNSRIEFIVKKLRSVIPDALTKNLIVLLTNVELEPLLKIKGLLDFPIDDSHIFYYNNQIFNLTPQYLNNKNILVRAQQSYENSIELLNNMIRRISFLSPFPKNLFCNMQELRDKFKTEVAIYEEKICEILIHKFGLENPSGENNYRTIDQETLIAQKKLLSLVIDAKKVCAGFDYLKEIDKWIKAPEERLLSLSSSRNSSGLWQQIQSKVQALSELQNIMERLKMELITGLKSLDKRENSCVLTQNELETISRYYSNKEKGIKNTENTENKSFLATCKEKVKLWLKSFLNKFKNHHGSINS